MDFTQPLEALGAVEAKLTPCGRTTTRGCPGPPRTLPCENHREDPEYGSHHLNKHDECYIPIVACMRNGCETAWQGFNPIVEQRAKSAAYNVYSARGTGTGSIDDMLQVARSKGWTLLLRSTKFTTPSGYEMAALLYTSMYNEVISWSRKESNWFRNRGKSWGDDDSNNYSGTERRQQSSVIGQTEQSAITRYQLTRLGELLGMYAESLGEERHDVAKRWIYHNYFFAMDFEKQHITSEDAEALLYEQTGLVVAAPTVRQWTRRFRRDLLRRAGPAGLDNDMIIRLAGLFKLNHNEYLNDGDEQ